MKLNIIRLAEVDRRKREVASNSSQVLNATMEGKMMMKPSSNELLNKFSERITELGKN